MHTSPATCTQALLFNILFKTQVPPGRKKNNSGSDGGYSRSFTTPSREGCWLLAAADGDWMLNVEKCQVLCHSTVPGTHSCTGAMNINHWLWTALSSKLEIQYGILLTKTHTQTGCLFILNLYILYMMSAAPGLICCDIVCKTGSHINAVVQEFKAKTEKLEIQNLFLSLDILVYMPNKCQH